MTTGIKISKKNFQDLAKEWSKENPDYMIHYYWNSGDRKAVASDLSYNGKWKHYTDYKYGTALWEILEVWVNEKQEAKEEMELVIGNKYVLHNKSIYTFNGLAGSNEWCSSGGKQQGFLFLKKIKGRRFTLGVNMEDDCGDFFTLADFTPYVKPKVGVQITKVEVLLDVWVWDDDKKYIQTGKLLAVLDKGTFPVKVLLNNQHNTSGFKHYSLTDPTPMRPLTIDELNEIYWDCRGTFRYRNWSGGIIVTDPRLGYSTDEKDSEYTTDEGKTWQKCEKRDENK